MSETAQELSSEAIVEDGKDILVVTSKLKKYIKERAGMNTAGNVVQILSERIRELCDQAIEKAKSDGRKTIKDRDFQ